MAEQNDRHTDGAPPTHVHIEKKRVNWLAWLLLALGVLALLLALSRCNRRDDQAAVTTTATNSSTVVAETADAPASTALAGTSALGGYLGGSEATPRTFTFEKLTFDTAKSDVRPADREEVTALAKTLKTYPKSHVRIAGYADTRGSDASNVALGKARADQVKAALVAQGIDAARIDTVSGGEKDPVDSNATATGRAENRRTEVIVTQR